MALIRAQQEQECQCSTLYVLSPEYCIGVKPGSSKQAVQESRCNDHKVAQGLLPPDPSAAYCDTDICVAGQV